MTLAGMALGLADLTAVGAFALALPLLSLLFARWSRPVLTLTREPAPAPLTVGQPASVALRVRNAGRRRTEVLALTEQVAPSVAPAVRLIVPSLAPGEDWSGAYPVRPGRRGRHRIGPCVLHRRDPLGLTSATQPVGEDTEILVLPPLHDLYGGDGPRGDGREGDDAASIHTGTERDASVREYRDGDDLRRVHWGMTAHRGQLMVRHEALPRARRAVLLLDVDAAGWGVADSPGFEWAVEALASVAAHLATRGYALHLVLGSQADDADPRPRAADPSAALRDVLHRLAVVAPVPDGRAASPRQAAYGSARELAGDGGLIVVATSGSDQGGVHEALDVTRAGGGGLALVVDVAAFARGADGRPGGPGGRAGDEAGELTAGELTAGELNASELSPGEVSAGEASAGEVSAAERWCAFARAGGWRAVAVTPSTTPRSAWARLTADASEVRR